MQLINKYFNYIKNSNILNKYIYIAAAMLFIFLWVSINFEKLTTISIIGDEFGYWLGGAFFSGVDWRDAAGCNAYYSFGYGIILAPLMKLIDDPIIMYKTAILINIALLEMSFLLAYSLSKKIIVDCGCFLRIIISLATILYVSNVFYIQVTMAETLLMFLFWLMCWLFTNFLKREKLLWLIFMTINCIYMYYVHQRALAIVLVYALCIIFWLIKNKNLKGLFVLIFCTSILIFIGQYVKSKYQLYLWGNDIDSISNVNDFSGNTDKIGYLLSVEGLMNFIAGVIGKVYYLGNASFLIVYVSIMTMLKKIFNSDEKKACKIFYTFLLLSMFFSIGISTTFMIYSSDNLQRLMYGRYNEYIITPLIMLGIFFIWKKEIKIKNLLFIIILHIFISFFILDWINIDISNSDFNWSTVIAVSDFWIPEKDSAYLVMVNTLRSIIVMFVFTFLMVREKKRCLFSILLVILIILWGNTSKDVSTEIMFLFREKQSETNVMLSNLIKDKYFEEKIYYLEKNIPYKIDYMQFLLKKRKIYKLNNLEDLMKIDGGIILTIIGSDDITKYMKNNYELVEESAIYYLWEGRK